MTAPATRMRALALALVGALDTIPRTHPLGHHELVVQDADDAVIGWTDVRVLKRAE